MRMSNMLAALVVSFPLACATTEGAASGLDPNVGAPDFPDGASCVPGESSTPCADLTPPRVDAKVLADGLMPEAHPDGLVRVKCQVTAEGEIRKCVGLQDEAGMAPADIKRLHLMRALPATLKGRPIRMDYVFNLNFKR